jgi:hypothetical protein
MDQRASAAERYDTLPKVRTPNVEDLERRLSTFLCASESALRIEPSTVHGVSAAAAGEVVGRAAGRSFSSRMSEKALLGPSSHLR